MKALGTPYGTLLAVNDNGVIKLYFYNGTFTEVYVNYATSRDMTINLDQVSDTTYVLLYAPKESFSPIVNVTVVTVQWSPPLGFQVTNVTRFELSIPGLGIAAVLGLAYASNTTYVLMIPFDSFLNPTNATLQAYRGQTLYNETTVSLNVAKTMSAFLDPGLSLSTLLDYDNDLKLLALATPDGTYALFNGTRVVYQTDLNFLYVRPLGLSGALAAWGWTDFLSSQNPLYIQFAYGPTTASALLSYYYNFFPITAPAPTMVAVAKLQNGTAIVAFAGNTSYIVPIAKLDLSTMTAEYCGDIALLAGTPADPYQVTIYAQAIALSSSGPTLFFASTYDGHLYAVELGSNFCNTTYNVVAGTPTAPLITLETPVTPTTIWMPSTTPITTEWFNGTSSTVTPTNTTAPLMTTSSNAEESSSGATTVVIAPKIPALALLAVAILGARKRRK
jgi:hypothetical protein